MNFKLGLLSTIMIPLLSFAKGPAPKGALPELKLNKKSEAENLKIAAEAESLISKSEEKAIKQLEALLKKYKGTAQEPDLLFRLAELYARRAKTGRFVDLYRGEKTLAEILTPKLTGKGAKSYLGQAITNYQTIQKQFPKYIAMDEVLFNMAFAHEQRGEQNEALKSFTLILEKYPNSKLLPEAHMALGELFFIKQNYVESLKNYDRVQEWPISPIAPIALYKSAWCSYNLKNTPEAIKKMERLLEQSRSKPLISHVRSEARRDIALFYSEVGSPDNAISYFKKHLLEPEIGPSILDLSGIYERHGKLQEMDLILALFLKEYPQDSNAGTILLRRVQHLNEHHKSKLVIEMLKESSKLCKNETWKKQQKETTLFCAETYPSELKDIVAEWWENWNKLKRSPDMVSDLAFAFTEYLQFEPSNNWNVGVHMSYADFLFSQKNYKQAGLHYEGVSKIEKIEPEILHSSLYGTIVSLDRLLQETPKEAPLRVQIVGALNNYITQCPKGEFIDEARYKKAFLFYEDKDYVQSIEWINKINPKNAALKEKREDLLLEIHRSKKDYQALVDSSLVVLKASTGERAQKIKIVYQAAQQSIIQDLVEKEKLSEAALRAKAFYEEHRPETKALDALHLAIELWEKLKKYRMAAESSEVLAKEMKALGKKTEAEQLSQHAVQLFLQLGDLERTQQSLPLSIEYAQKGSKKKDALELLAEISSWYGNVDSTEKAWQALESQMNSEEKQVLLQKRIKFFEQQAPEKAKKLKESLVQKGIEPFFSESQIKAADKLCQEKKWQPCYQMALKLNRDATPPNQRAQARFLQSRVLIHEYQQQGLKASPDRIAMVMSYKAEKFDKAVQVLTTISQKSEILQLRKQAVQDLISLYNDYVTQLQKSASTLDINNPDLASLKQEIDQILPVLAQRPKELESALAELNKMDDANNKNEALALSSPFPELNGSEMRIYVPTWEETSPRRPLSEIVVSAQSCSLPNIQKMNSQSALGREANSCLLKRQTRELDVIALRLSDLFPDSHWGPYYSALSAAQQHSMDRALWYLKLAQKRNPDSILAYEEARQGYVEHPDSASLVELQKHDGTWGLVEESAFLSTLQQLKQNQCAEAQSSLKDLRSKYWKATAIEKIVSNRCPSSQRTLSSSDSND